MLPREDLIQLLTHATVFVCPSIYEPLGIVNLEAMACETAVVASDVGGIPEVVVDGETGTARALRRVRPGDLRAFAWLRRSTRWPATLPGRRRTAWPVGARAVDVFGWDDVAAETVAVYQSRDRLPRSGRRAPGRRTSGCST